MTTCIKNLSREAYSCGQGALAKELSEQGKQHKRTMEALNSKASAWIFQGTLLIYLYPPSLSGLMSDIDIVQRTTWFVDAISYCAWLVSNHSLTRTG